jgi:uncharacterized protein
MKSQNIDAAGPLHTRVLVLDSGEEAFSSLQSFARDADITAASLTAIGSFERATVEAYPADSGRSIGSRSFRSAA